MAIIYKAIIPCDIIAMEYISDSIACGIMCYPIAVQRATTVEVTGFSKKWSPLQIVKSINKSLIRQDNVLT